VVFKNGDGKPRRLVGVNIDITERRKTEEDMARLLSELQRSNKELEQFAYIASHDLQEPLRMIASYVQLLEQKYKGRLDEKADKYIYFAVDGALRMQNLIEALLAYSRVTTRGAPFDPVDTNLVFTHVVVNLSAVIKENHAVVTKDPLPTVRGDEAQLAQLFQNLIGNAIKFRKPDTPPLVHVSAKKARKQWAFSVRDNGIGMEAKYFDRIFQIFQRLHTHAEYPGTGIGLAICKRIVERHGGRIWLESAPGEGTTFFFTLATTGEDNDTRGR
jgi:light-regulated signal transduction histidine kinase (bacteriophytochrome)